MDLFDLGQFMIIFLAVNLTVTQPYGRNVGYPIFFAIGPTVRRVRRVIVCRSGRGEPLRHTMMAVSGMPGAEAGC
jgi:hypothetical protein